MGDVDAPAVKREWEIDTCTIHPKALLTSLVEEILDVDALLSRGLKGHSGRIDLKVLSIGDVYVPAFDGRLSFCLAVNEVFPLKKRALFHSVN